MEGHTNNLCSRKCEWPVLGSNTSQVWNRLDMEPLSALLERELALLGQGVCSIVYNSVIQMEDLGSPD